MIILSKVTQVEDSQKRKSSVLRAASVIGMAHERDDSITFMPRRAWVAQPKTVSNESNLLHLRKIGDSKLILEFTLILYIFLLTLSIQSSLSNHHVT